MVRPDLVVQSSTADSATVMLTFFGIHLIRADSPCFSVKVPPLLTVPLSVVPPCLVVTVVKLVGHGKGGRNQEFALAAAPILEDIPNVALVSVGSDGTDGPTDAAGGYVDGNTAATLRSKGLSVENALAENDSYPTLAAVDGLVVTGPTGTNVNDVAIGLVDASISPFSHF